MRDEFKRLVFELHIVRCRKCNCFLNMSARRPETQAFYCHPCYEFMGLVDELEQEKEYIDLNRALIRDLI